MLRNESLWDKPKKKGKWDSVFRLSSMVPKKKKKKNYSCSAVVLLFPDDVCELDSNSTDDDPPTLP